MKSDPHLERKRTTRVGPAVSALAAAAAAYAVLVVTNDPRVLLAIGAGVLALFAVSYLSQRPLIALYVGIFLLLYPFGIRPHELDFVYDAMMNGGILLALLAWAYRSYSDRAPIIWNEVYLLIALYIVWAVVTLIWTPDLVLGRKKLVLYCLDLTVLFLIVQQVRSLQALDGLMRVLSILGWCVAIAGLLAMTSGDYAFGQRLKIFDMNENAFGYFFTMTFPGVIWPVLGSTGVKRRVYMLLSIAFIICSMVVVAATGSRGSALSLVTMLVAFWFWKPLRPWGILGGIAVVCVLAAAPFLLELLSNRANDDWGNEVGARDLLWKATLELIGDQPFTGAGIGNGPIALNPYIGTLTDDFLARDDLPSHNPFLEVGADTGILGMIIYISIAVCAVRQFIRHRERWKTMGAPLAAYHPIVMVSGVAYFASFIKDGGMENHPTYIVLLALLIIPTGFLDSSSKPTLMDNDRRGPPYA